MNKYLIFFLLSFLVSTINAGRYSNTFFSKADEILKEEVLENLLPTNKNHLQRHVQGYLPLYTSAIPWPHKQFYYNGNALNRMNIKATPYSVFMSHLFPDSENLVPNQGFNDPILDLKPEILGQMINHLQKNHQDAGALESVDKILASNLYKGLATLWHVKHEQHLQSISPDLFMAAQALLCFKDVYESQMAPSLEEYVSEISDEALRNNIQHLNKHLQDNPEDYNAYYQQIKNSLLLEEETKDLPFEDHTHWAPTQEVLEALKDPKRTSILSGISKKGRKVVRDLRKRNTLISLIQSYQENPEETLGLLATFFWEKASSDQDIADFFSGVTGKPFTDEEKEALTKEFTPHDFIKLHQQIEEDQKMFWTLSPIQQTFYLTYSDLSKFKGIPYGQARILIKEEEKTFSDCFESAIYTSLVTPLWKKTQAGEEQESLSYFDTSALPDCPLKTYLEEFSNPLDQMMPPARDRRAQIVAQLPEFEYAKKAGYEVKCRPFNYVNAANHLLALGMEPLSSGSKAEDYKEPFQRIGEALGITLSFEESEESEENPLPEDLYTSEVSLNFSKEEELLGTLTIDPKGPHAYYIVQSAQMGGDNLYAPLIRSTSTPDQILSLVPFIDDTNDAGNVFAMLQQIGADTPENISKAVEAFNYEFNIERLVPRVVECLLKKSLKGGDNADFFTQKAMEVGQKIEDLEDYYTSLNFMGFLNPYGNSEDTILAGKIDLVRKEWPTITAHVESYLTQETQDPWQFPDDFKELFLGPKAPVVEDGEEEKS